MQENIKCALEQFKKDAVCVLGNRLDQIILYGSYARGDFHEDSDIDLLLLVNLPQEEMWDYRKQLSYKACDINFQYDTMIVPMMVNTEHYQDWLAVYPFYKNVSVEGVLLFAS